MLVGLRARYRRLPEFTCHACGYDMVGREAGDPCPECDASFAPRTRCVVDSVSFLNIVIGTCVLAIVGMVFVPPIAFLSMLLWAFVGARWNRIRHLGRARVSERVWGRSWILNVLIWVVLIEFSLLMIADTIYPPLFEWW